MAEPFKLLMGPAVVQALGHHLQRVWAPFPRQAFEQQSLEGLDALALKARVAHLARALAGALPADFATAADVLEASLRPVIEHRRDPDLELGLLVTNEDGLAGWALWPMGDYVAEHGLDQPERALQVLHALTQRNTAEFAIRPFLERHPALSLAALQAWVSDPSAHVRRLVSEGSRPRLPWGMQLRFLVADPSPTLPLLRALQDDPSAYVRRSVANHLNDIAKDHPHEVVNWLTEHLPGASAERRRLLRHASRTLIKQGHPAALAAWGLGNPLEGTAELTVPSPQAQVGGSVALEVTLHSQGAGPQRLEMDYRVGRVQADGRPTLGAKTFKGKRLDLGPGEVLRWRKLHPLKVVSTRRQVPGDHRVELLVNGRVVAVAAFQLGEGAPGGDLEATEAERDAVDAGDARVSRPARPEPPRA